MKRRGKKPLSTLSPEERCKRAFDAWYVGGVRDWYAISFPEIDADLRDAAAWVAWTQCWKHLQSQVAKLIAS
jgi:hypothetical protein